MRMRAMGRWILCVGVALTLLYELNISADANAGKTYIIAQDGTGDFVTINEGVVHAESGDTLLVYPGIYEESVDIIGKTINLIGVDKEKCILCYDGARYSKPPLNYCGGDIKNLTIYAKKPQQLCEDEVMAYAIHIDQQACQKQKIVISNCKIVSEASATLGIGLWGEESIAIEDSIIIAKEWASCNIFIHDAVNADYGGKAEFQMKDCVLENYTFYNGKLTLWSLESFNQTYFTFQNVIVSETVDGGHIAIENRDQKEPLGWCGLNNMFLTDDSYGNTMSEMNAR